MLSSSVITVTPGASFGPNCLIELCEVGRTCQLGAVVKLGETFLGIIPRHLFGDNDSVTIRLTDGTYVGRYTRTADEFRQIHNDRNRPSDYPDIAELLTTFEISRELVSHDRGTPKLYWPSRAVNMRDAIAMKVGSLKDHGVELGHVSQTFGYEKLVLRPGLPPTIYKKTLRITVTDPALIAADKRDLAGAVFIARDGRMLGLAVAWKAPDIILAPLDEYLRQRNLVPWVAPTNAFFVTPAEVITLKNEVWAPALRPGNTAISGDTALVLSSLHDATVGWANLASSDDAAELTESLIEEPA